MSSINITSALTGGLAAAFLTLISRHVFDRLAAWRLSRGITAEAELLPSGGARIRFTNTGVRAIESAIVYLSLDFDPVADCADSATPDRVIIGPHHPHQLTDDRLCWAAMGNPYQIDIYPGERQAADFFRITEGAIELPSELGWAQDDGDVKSRALLTSQAYKGEIYIVSKNTIRRAFDVSIDPHTEDRVRLTPTEFIGRMKFIWG